MIDKIKMTLTSQKFYSFAGSIFAAGFSLVNFSLLARVLSKEEFGLWGLFLTIFGLFDMVRNGLVGRPLVKMASEGDEDYYNSLVKSALKICFLATFLISLFVAAVLIIIWLIGDDSFYLELSGWFAICAILTIPTSFAVWTNSSKIKFQRVVAINAIRRFIFLFGVVILYFTETGLREVFVVYSLSTLATSLIALLLKWTGILRARFYKAVHVKKIFDFGKYSMGTMLGSSALTNSDNLLIMTFLGPEALAVYQVPMRIIGLYDIPLRSLVQIAYPTLAKVKSKQGSGRFLKEFEASNGFTFLVLLPLSVLIFVFAKPLVILLGGEGYEASAPILQIFAVYLAITPLDRFGGVALDVLNRPNLNFRKMALMLFVNVVGDLLAIYYTESINYVAFVSIFTFSLGTVMSFYYLRDDLPFRLVPLIEAGKGEFIRVYNKFFGNQGQTKQLKG